MKNVNVAATLHISEGIRSLTVFYAEEALHLPPELKDHFTDILYQTPR